jgi:hypothetical protein
MIQEAQTINSIYLQSEHRQEILKNRNNRKTSTFGSYLGGQNIICLIVAVVFSSQNGRVFSGHQAYFRNLAVQGFFLLNSRHYCMYGTLRACMAAGGFELFDCACCWFDNAVGVRESHRGVIAKLFVVQQNTLADLRAETSS